MLTTEQQSTLRANMKALAEKGVSRLVFRSLFAVDNRRMAPICSGVGVSFGSYTMAPAVEMRKLLQGIGIPDVDIDAALDFHDKRFRKPRKPRTTKRNAWKRQYTGTKPPENDELHDLIRAQVSIAEICGRLNQTAKAIADTLRGKGDWETLKRFNALPKTRGEAKKFKRELGLA